MTSQVEMTFAKPKKLFRKTEYKKIFGKRVEFSASRFFNVTEDWENSEFFCAICEDVNLMDEAHIYAASTIKDTVSANIRKFNIYDDQEQLLNLVKPGDKLVLLGTNAVSAMPFEAELKHLGVTVISLSDYARRYPKLVPNHAWAPVEKNIYPIRVPRPDFKKELDFLLIDCPSRNLSMMPNGLGYVHNAIKKTGISHQTYDIDIVAYHRFHMHRIYDVAGDTIMPSGFKVPKDPWLAENYDIWSKIEVSDYIYKFLADIIDAICEAKPKVIGMSIQECNENVSRMVARVLKARMPGVIIVVGGFSCYSATIGLRAFPLADYMCIGEADLTIGDLIKKLSKGETPKDLPGILSIHDTPHRLFIPAPMENDLDKLEDPRYEWFPLSVYRNWDGYQLTPVIASRGCRWSRCTFCAERFYWRIRDPKKFVDELEYLVSEGCHLFMFNESDLNGSPETVLKICDEIISRGLKIKLTAQLRIHKKCDRAFYEKLALAGFVALRFGVDAFSENTLKLQKKGYTKDTVRQNLRDCWESGIYTEVNWVIGVPGETDEDCEEGVDFILENQKYIGRVSNINPLLMVNGSVYWIDPESHGIRFNGDREKLFEQNERYVPSALWYSVDPYIDASVRKKRFENIIVSLIEGGFELGPWASKVYNDVKTLKSDGGGRAIAFRDGASGPLQEWHTQLYDEALGHVERDAFDALVESENLINPTDSVISRLGELIETYAKEEEPQNVLINLLRSNKDYLSELKDLNGESGAFTEDDESVPMPGMTAV
jgi:radical SAM superfamily enzyme YgiQ (UPF0313 family)